MKQSEELDYMNMSVLGDKAKEFMESEFWAFFDTHVLQELDRKSFETFKKVEPSATLEVMQCQIMSKMIGQIKSELSSLIEQGQYAKTLLLSTQLEDENG